MFGDAYWAFKFCSDLSNCLVYFSFYHQDAVLVIAYNLGLTNKCSYLISLFCIKILTLRNLCANCSSKNEVGLSIKCFLSIPLTL